LEAGGLKATTITHQELVSDPMADNSLFNPTYRGYSFSSANNKEDIITMELQHFRIALQIMAGHPEVLNEFKQKVKSDANQRAPGRTEEPCLERMPR
jgi:hypothetical protein